MLEYKLLIDSEINIINLMNLWKKNRSLHIEEGRDYNEYSNLVIETIRPSDTKCDKDYDDTIRNKEEVIGLSIKLDRPFKIYT
jgi:hypothetical protein